MNELYGLIELREGIKTDDFTAIMLNNLVTENGDRWRRVEFSESVANRGSYLLCYSSKEYPHLAYLELKPEGGRIQVGSFGGMRWHKQREEYFLFALSSLLNDLRVTNYPEIEIISVLNYEVRSRLYGLTRNAHILLDFKMICPISVYLKEVQELLRGRQGIWGRDLNKTNKLQFFASYGILESGDPDFARIARVRIWGNHEWVYLEMEPMEVEMPRFYMLLMLLSKYIYNSLREDLQGFRIIV